MSHECEKSCVDKNREKAGVESPNLSATLTIMDNDTGAVLSEIHIDSITDFSQHKSLQQYPVECAPGRRLMVPGSTVIKFEGIQEMTAERLVDYVDRSLKPSLESMMMDANPSADVGTGTIASISADRPLGLLNHRAFGIPKDRFDEIAGAFSPEHGDLEDE